MFKLLVARCVFCDDLWHGLAGVGYGDSAKTFRAISMAVLAVGQPA